MASDDEDYRDLFFTEADELVSELQDLLARLQDGERDPELVNAAFRAVHSVKGGAAAFGLADLIDFAHLFESVMDACRKDASAVDTRTVDILMRATDVIQDLLECAQSGRAPSGDARRKVEDDLRTCLAPGTAPPEPAEPATEEKAADASPDNVVIEFEPADDFILCGHDPLRVIRAARAVGLDGVDVTGAVPSLAELDPMVCPFRWSLTFDGSDPATLRDFFAVYDLSANVAGLPPPQVDPTPKPKHRLVDNESEPPAGGRGAGFPKSLRVELPRIDRLVNLVGEVVILQAALAQDLQGIDAQGGMTESRISRSLETLSRQVREMQDSVMAIRAQPIKSVFSRMPRVVRDLSDILGREVRLDVSGEQTEVDTTVIEELVEPLTHMLRNAMDHGIERPEEREAAGKSRQGHIHLTAEHRGERVVITVSDDGRGIDRSRVAAVALERGLITSVEGLTPDDIDNLIFLPGFSTASTVSEVSGRGVGMDVVKRKIQALGGRCSLRSQPGEGTEIQITLPLTLAVLDGMVVEASGEQYVLPLSIVVETVRLSELQVDELPGGVQVIGRRGEYLARHDLSHLLGLPEPDDPDMILIIETEDEGRVGLAVDGVIGQRQVVLKSLEANYRSIEGVSGATILGDGRVALIVDPTALLALERRQHTALAATATTPAPQETMH